MYHPLDVVHSRHHNEMLLYGILNGFRFMLCCALAAFSFAVLILKNGYVGMADVVDT